MAFNYTYKPIDYATASKQANGQLDPLYQRAVAGVNQQKYANDVQAGQVAAARGLGHSGLAADQLNKIAIAAQGNVADLNAQKMTQAAQMARDMVSQDKQYSLQNRAQLYNEYNSNRGYNYQLGRDKVGDKQWQNQFNYNKSLDSRNFNYQKGVDSRNFNYQQSQNKADQAWRQYTYNHMSAGDKAQLEWAKSQYGEDAAWRMYELQYNGTLQKSISDSELANFQGDGKGAGYSKPVSGNYSKEINTYAKSYGVDANLVRAVAMQESSLGKASNNVMQVNGMSNSSPAASIQAGSKMLGNLLKKTGGNIKEALAAYNMGEGILSFFKSNGGYSVANMNAFSEMQKKNHGYRIYGDPYYVEHVLKYYG
jgi:hypothetical protein